MKVYYRLKTVNLWGMALFIIFTLMQAGYPDIKTFQEVNHIPNIDPDYTGITIPPNIAPLNFMINETGIEYCVDIYGKNNDNTHIHILTKKNKILIPLKKWQKVLLENRGKELHIDIYVKDKLNTWKKFTSIVNRIANERIDNHVVYRLINPAYVLWWEMGIYQRNLENFDESAIFTNRATKKNCMNCHSFCNNNPDLMMFHMRADYGGMMLITHDSVNKIETKTDYTMSAGVYPAWHPDGKHIAFSVNKIFQSFHSQKDKNTFVWDRASDLVIYDIQTNTVTTSPKVSTKLLENLPNWSPDGKYLYFCRGPEYTDEKNYDEYRYDLERIPCDVETGNWGDVETIIPAAKMGKSVCFPKISPDGKYLLFSMSDYGYFSIHLESSDLYLLDLATKQYRKLAVNSESSEGYHSWSSNSRWFVFASKRKDGLCSRLYFSYVDSSGGVYKPLLMPQKDPAFYDSFIKNYNVPELITGPVTINYRKLLSAARGKSIPAKFDSTVDINALSGATKITKSLH